jgi:hypothetical protein
LRTGAAADFRFFVELAGEVLRIDRICAGGKQDKTAAQQCNECSE